MVFLIAFSAVIGWLIGINFAWWLQVPLFLGTIYLWKYKCDGLEGIPGAVSLGIVWLVAMAGNLVSAINRPCSFDFLRVVGGWFLP